MKWVIESYLNPAAKALADVVGADAVQLPPDWRDARNLPPKGSQAIFYGSLQGCEAFQGYWTPGVVGTAWDLKFTSWTGNVEDISLNPTYLYTTVANMDKLRIPWERVFVRPDSAMKPFAGRVLERSKLSPEALDYGFYYDDPNTEILIAPFKEIKAEWRFVCCRGAVVASSNYIAEGRQGTRGDLPPLGALEVAKVAADRMRHLPAVVADIALVVESKNKSRYCLVEYNLFSGADLYYCNPVSVYRALNEG